MQNLKKLSLALIVVATIFAYLPQESNADGPLRRWWRNLTGRNNCGCTTPARQTAFSPTAVAPNAYGLQPGQCMRTCQKTCSRTVVNYVPQTAYRTSYKRVPVTQYRPVTNSDPCTGCTVTCMKPCTTYTYQCQRVPYTTYRPVYRTETYKVPVTTITNDCATGTCGTCPTGTRGTSANYAPATNYVAPAAGCSTCGTNNYSASVPSQNYLPAGSQVPTPASTTQSYTVDPSTGLSTQGSFNSTPANQVPTLDGVPNPQSSQRPRFNQFNPGTQQNLNASSPRSMHEQLHQPTRANAGDYTAKNPIRKSWDYSPVRFASIKSVNERRVTAYAGSAKTVAPVRKSRWVEID
jgi:hypothetical protein